MTDVHSPETRSYNMSRFRGKDTRPEMVVRKFLFSMGSIADAMVSDTSFTIKNFPENLIWFSRNAGIDPYHQQRGIGGLPGGAKQCQPIWDEFIDNREELIFESERILAKWKHNSLEGKYVELFSGIENLKGETKLREVKTRINQNVFRQIVLANYSSKCAITGIDIPDFLVASRIIPWSKNERCLPEGKYS